MQYSVIKTITRDFVSAFPINKDTFTMATMGGRIPASLQAIFMASNKGEEVYVPPTDNSANRVYRRNRSEDGKAVIVKFAGSSLKRTLSSVSLPGHR